VTSQYQSNQSNQKNKPVFGKQKTDRHQNKLQSSTTRRALDDGDSDDLPDSRVDVVVLDNDFDVEGDDDEAANGRWTTRTVSARTTKADDARGFGEDHDGGD